jgi:D-3-phosphoglycerate dehydrogenase
VTHKTVLVTDHTWASTEVEAEILAKVGAKIVDAPTGDEAELLSLVPEAAGILTCFAKVPASVIRAGRRLQVIGRYGVGVDNINVEEASRLGILVTNVPTYCVDEVSDHAMALLLACARKVCAYDAAIHTGNWSLQVGAPMYRLRGRTLGLLGLGKIGLSMAGKGRAFGLRVIAHDPYANAAQVQSHGVELVDLDTLFAQADYLSLHAPLTPETRGIVNEGRLRRMKRTAIIVNAARGPIIDQAALITALREGWIAGAGLDVFEQENLPADHPLWRAPNLIATPHVAFYSEESLVDLRTLATLNVAAVLSDQRPAAIVNPTVLNLPRWAHLR